MPSKRASLREKKSRTTILWPIEAANCPYGNAERNTCGASLSSMQRDGSVRQTYCDSEDYDDCPIFLAKMLRRG